MSRVLGGLDPQAFIADYWQQRPLLVRSAFAEPPPGLTPEELAGLATEPDVESRVVMGETAREDWMLLHGPFEPAFFSDTPDQDWTLLVQDADKHLPALAAWLAPFRFLPAWRIDDLMVSYAAPGGTVGPHLDRYDVFLIQGQGRRRWRIQQPPPATEVLRGHPDLRLLADFEATEEWLLEPGDLLYLPPGIPHYGIAEDECMTYSVGFRAPSGPELLDAWARENRDAPGDNERYHDSPDTLAAHGRLPAPALARLRRLFREAADAPDVVLDDWLARHLTATKPGFRELSGADEDAASVEARLAAGRSVRLNPATRLVTATTAGGEHFYCHGQRETVPPVLRPLIRRLADRQELSAADLPGEPGARRDALTLLVHWRRGGRLLFDDDLERGDDDA